jgi:ribonuclease E
MANKMLIDASHPEETRVVVTRGQRVEEFDFESATRRQLRGNIYLAKVTRVEPSLQAAFVEYGGNRHGFLAFSEIHPDYYQIPFADRQALIEADARAEQEFERDEDRRRGRRRSRGARRGDRDEAVRADASAQEPVASDTLSESTADEGDFEDLARSEERAFGIDDENGGAPSEAAAAAHAFNADDPRETQAADQSAWPEPEAAAAGPSDDAAPAPGPWSDAEPAEAASPASDLAADDEPAARAGSGEEAAHEEDEEGDEEDEEGEEGEEEDEEDVIEQVGGDALEEIQERPRAHRRHYKIQEVIKRRQVLLVQVVKEERGNKGAALTTYLSLAGRYSVLMPNTGKGGGISRKITSAEDRRRLKEVVQDLEVPEGMGVILRTAGASRTRAEIKRDFEYLMRLWESVRELTLASSAPMLVYEEGSLIKRAIRDLYNKDIDEVIVAGEEGYREAKDFMRMLMPSHAKVVKPYRDPQPLFARSGVEGQLDTMFSNHVTLRSGGYLVINPTEALVSIDVNSGRATREHNIEDTALKTNSEAAEEIARQLRLRDLAGLIVIDFIDMEEKRNNRAVEKKLKDCLKNDRARIQVGRISPFGLMEMSRQRIRTGILESSSVPCRHCGGTGFVRATPSVALQVLRSIEESLIRSASHNLVVRARGDIAVYILNQKRGHLRELEYRFGVTIAVVPDEHLSGTTSFAIDRGEPATPVEPRPLVTGAQAVPIEPEEDDDAELDDEESEEAEGADESSLDSEAEDSEAAENGEENGTRRRRRRRRRRGRGGEGRPGEERGGEERGQQGFEPENGGERRDEEVLDELAEATLAEAAGPPAAPAPEPDRAPEVPPPPAAGAAPELIDLAQAEAWAPQAPIGGNGDARPPQPAEEAPAAEPAPEPEPEPVAVVLTPPDPDRPKRAGWWSRTKSVLSG